VQKLLWLDDDARSISHERDILIPDYFEIATIKIISFEKIDELLEYLWANTIHENDVFIIDIMLISEDEIMFPEEKTIFIPDDLMAGATLYQEFLRNKYPMNPIVLYTSREHDGDIFKTIKRDSRYGKNIYLIDKWKKDTEFIDILKKIIRKPNA